MPRLTLCALAVLSLAAPAVHAADTPDDAPLPQVTLAPQVVTATRTDRPADGVPTTVTRQDAEALARRQPRDLKDLLADEVDAEISQGPARYTAAGTSVGRAGNDALTIRGLGGNRVLMLVDGVRLPQAFAFGPFATGRGDYVDVDLLGGAELLRGPSSAAWGSDGLVGALSLTTLNPADLLDRQPGADQAGFARITYNGADRSTLLSGGLALQTPERDWQALLVVSRKRGHALINQGDNTSANTTRTAPNPLDADTTGVLAKLQWQANAAHRLSLSAESSDRSQQTDVLSARAAVPTPPSPTNPYANQTVALNTDDASTRRQLGLEHRWTPDGETGQTRLVTRLYGQQAEVSQFSNEDRAFSPDRTRDNRYKERTLGLTMTGQTPLPALLGERPSRLSGGLDVSEARISSLRDGTLPPYGETFPSKPFPDTRYRLAGAFVQGELEAGDWTLLPALRADHFALKPDATDYSGTAVSLSGQAITPRLGVIWRASPAFAPYAQAATGFRAPTPAQVNNGFENRAAGYASIGNPDLKPEHARSIELGVRGKAGPVRWQAAYYDNRYRDFIEQTVVGGAGTPADPIVFQYVNLSSARIRGVELRADADLAPGWQAQFAVARARGESTSEGERTPLASVGPLRLRAALRWTSGPWDASAQVVHAAAQSAARSPSATQYLPPAYTTLDLRAAYSLPAQWLGVPLTASLALINATDATYWRWSDVQGLALSSPVIDAYTAPGRHVQLGLRADF
ncbi:MAG: TonB-dependent receptor [Proteobacteria bacterium]|nr:TonB-dependent receptor [Pseudomonadota bacterium]